jgi:hypothetical protein
MKLGRQPAMPKAKGADQMAGVSRAAHNVADELGKEVPQAAGFIHSAAEKLESASSALSDHSIEEPVPGVNSFARRQSAAAFAGSILAGLLPFHKREIAIQHSTS